MRKSLLRKRAVTLLGAVLYALFASLGYRAQGHGHVDIPHALLVALALLAPIYALLAWLLRRSGDASPADTAPFRTGRAFLLILGCYVPMLLIAYPGSFAYDVPFQLRQVFTGSYSTHHPLLHTLLLGLCVSLGRLLGSINLGAALYTVLQMTALAGCFAAACASISRTCGARAARRSAVFFALYPLHMFMAVNATKDVLFGGLLALTLALSFEALCAPPDSMRPGLAAALILSGAGMMLLRNNALYAVAAWLPLLLACRCGKRLFACMLAAAVLCAGANGAMKAATGAEDGDLAEMLSLPIQQLARARCTAGDRLSEDELQAIDRIMPGESWQLYDPTISDPVKFRFDTQEFLRDTRAYAGVYLSVGAKCPDVYIDALLAHTCAFWYPYSAYRVSGYYLQMGVSTEQLDAWCGFDWITQVSPLRRVLESLSWRFGAQGAMQIPVIGYAFNTGVIIWVMFFFVLREMHAGRARRVGVALLPVLLWGTFLLGPVMAGRYVYPFVCILPVLASRPSGESV